MAAPDMVVDERRKYPRRTSREGAYAVLQSHPPRLGRVVDLSLGGLAFHYVDGDPVEPQLPGLLDVFMVGSAVALRQVFVRPRSDIRLSDSTDSKAVMRRCGVKFLALAPEQNDTLERLLEDFSVAPA